MKNCTLPLLICLMISCNSATKTTSEQERWQAQAHTIEIIRDHFGVPHIYGTTDADAVFGLLYAQCEDDFNRVEQNYIWATGRLAEVEGEGAIYSDLRAKMFMTEAEAKANFDKSPDWLKELCNAFADGINYYLHTHPEVKPRLITKFEPWMPMYFSEGSIGGDIERVSTQKIKAFYDGISIDQFEFIEELTKKAEAEPAGSNGIAIHGKLTKSGNPILLINPHTSFFFRGEVHVISEEGLNAYGAVTWGQFFIYQGFNEKTGWMHTSTYTDVIDEFEEDLVKVEGKLMYRYGEELREVEMLETTLKYKDGDEIKSRTFPFYRTHHGPITQSTQDGKWIATAMMWEPVKALEQSYIRSKKDGYKGFREMMDIKTNSSNNTVYADSEGNIGYFHGNFIPKRDVSFDYQNPVDGSNPKTDWQGLHDVDEHITLLNPENGWLQNCNSTPFTAAAEFSPKQEDYPNYMSLNRENFRGVHAIDLLSKNKDYTINSVIELAYDPFLPAFEVLIPGLVLAFKQSEYKDKNIYNAVEILSDWDYKTSKESVAMTLAHYYGMNIVQNGKRPRTMNSMELFEYFGGETSPQNEKLELFANTVNYLNETFGSWNLPWGQVNRYQRLNSDIEQKFDDNKPSIPVGFASGRWGALAAYGVSYTNPEAKKIYGTRGNSFVAVVEFGDKVKAKTILAGGQSSDTTSVHFNDQAKPYVDMEFKDVPFYREDVLNVAKKIYKPGEGI